MLNKMQTIGLDIQSAFLKRVVFCHGGEARDLK